MENKMGTGLSRGYIGIQVYKQLLLRNLKLPLQENPAIDEIPHCGKLI